MAGNRTTVLAKARGQLGYVEGPAENQNIFSAYWHEPRQPWCADFACWALQMGGALDVPRSSYTPALADAYRARGRFSRSPRIGSLVFFQWPDMGRIAHVGIVESIGSGSIITIEGNTDVAGGRTGGRVMRKARRANIAGYGHPIYASVPKPVSSKPAYHADYMPGDRAPDLKLVHQRFRLVAQDMALYDTPLRRTIRAFKLQRSIGGNPDVIDRTTWTEIWR